MRKSEIVAKRLAEFSAVVQKDLEQYAAAQELLLPGQRIVFSVTIEKAPTVVQYIDAGREALLDLPVGDFFTRERLESTGCDSAVAARVINVISGERISHEGNGEQSYTVRHFIDNYGHRLRRNGSTFLPNAGSKSKQTIIRALEAAGVWKR